ncbi:MULTISPECIES: hypothetical protein [Bacillus]|uniref:Uncharacterized protein n=1 Tax=Bacillus capparidis TaxID=1840411 RepID=A0ABS4CY61_9BACI|nr:MULTISPECIES: hypothetical protein [Bacillus]MBP1082303.1 hypothetical protein [Bacillus capparidis]MED1097436.1 hypothetical protein [Bacillus capparidis]
MKENDINKKMLEKLDSELHLIYKLKKPVKVFNKSKVLISVAPLIMIVVLILFVRNSSIDGLSKALTISTISLFVTLLYPIYRDLMEKYFGMNQKINVGDLCFTSVLTGPGKRIECNSF